ncbi:flagellar hook-length control protein FliK [Accumulibacter sp.]|uniref:flagellar hook-length control protein FliK n=1 Tax=Accumulibacter sp. TaxID=2053492 RepID=UPI0025CEE90C|nr:flagellar hook-length control protein FliK [Accumulibacter sp.]MCM8596746.1 flagellar hook-length control protein FliK [Accumulibacter sp.]MCM8624720.1 flagellar hook-length control protein FliK [Accumulibacter sp.]MDS4050895.1 flagellar hook-length control protein FliK [Accumulibacter sp.]
MIRADLDNRLPAAGGSAPRATLPLRQLADSLQELIPGQRLLAEIQAVLPDGSYRALINQRSVTLALPHAVKAGDVIELEVRASDGQLTLAVLRGASPAATSAELESAATRLSVAGRLIGQLLGQALDAGKTPMPLNASQPIASGSSAHGAELLPLLRQAIVESGMFYEAHQARWVAGDYSKSLLLREPQGRLEPRVPARTASPPLTPDDDRAGNARSETTGTIRAAPASGESALSSNAVEPVAEPLRAIVQQQLEALATHSFIWQGQVWPGQSMDWIIDRSPDGQAGSGADSEATWETRLRLTLPRLGEVDARIGVQGSRIVLSLLCASSESREILVGSAPSLHGQFEQAGLAIVSLGFAGPDDTGHAAPAA